MESNIGIVVLFGCLAIFTLWFIASGSHDEEYSDDPYMTYSHLVSPGNSLGWMFLGFLLPILSGVAVGFMYGWVMSYFWTCLALPAGVWVAVRMIRKTTRLPNEIALALVWLEPFRTTKRVTSFENNSSGIGWFVDKHWTKIVSGYDERGLFLNFDHRSYLIRWDSGISLSESRVKPPEHDSLETVLAVLIPAPIKLRILVPATANQIQDCLGFAYQDLAD